MCQYLSEEMKIEFLDNANISNTKSKLNYLFGMVHYYKEALEYSKKREDLFKKFLILKLIFDQYMFWKDLSFMITIVFNILIIMSHKKINPPSNEVRLALFHKDENEDFTKFLFICLSTTQLVLFILILINYVVKSISKYTWKDIKKWETIQEKSSTFKTCIIFIYRVITDFNLIYNIAFVVFAVLGILYNYFYFSMHLVESINRSTTLRNVLKAIWNPRKQIMVTLILLFLVEYFFTILVFLFFYNDVDGQLCHRMDTCLITIFDQTFKNFNGIINYLSEVNYKDDHSFSGRFWLDNMFYIVILLLVLQMLAGIIIDNFSALRETQQFLIDDRNNFCFICGLHRNDLNKLYGNEEGYSEHVLLDHYCWNYMFLIINLTKKKYLSGLDYYIFNNYKNESYIWIPFENCKKKTDVEEKALEKLDI